MAIIAAADFRLPKDDLSQLLSDRRAAERWARGSIDPVRGGSCRLTDRADVEWVGHVVDIEAGRPIVLHVPVSQDPNVALVDIRLEVLDSRRSNEQTKASRLEISVDDRVVVSDQATLLWNTVLNRLTDMVGEIKRRRTPEQAVVVIHGIGEQLPGRTLEKFVAAVNPDDEAPVWSRSDRLSDSYELRQLTLSASRDRPKTTFYEYYWAHQVHDTTPGDVLGWVWSLMGRMPWSIPRQLRVAWFGLWAFVVAIAFTAFAFGRGLDQVRWISTIITIPLAGLVSLLIRYLGDAARYLSPRPRNVAIRQAIRKGGIELVRELHRTGRYHRIVLVGHSLGSVVAYDIVQHLWADMHAEHERPDSPTFKAIGAAHDAVTTPVAQRAQAAVWREMRRNTQPWLVTDLVTLGSPLAHADLLLARDRQEFDAKRDRNEISVAPPVANSRGGRFSYNRPYTSRSARAERSFTVLDESAAFAAVRWTNIYVPAVGGVFGDLVGGPISPIFGHWVLDVPVGSTLRWWSRFSLLSHTSYWKPLRRRDTPTHKPPDRITALRTALDLDERRDLAAAARGHDPILYCEVRR